MGNSILLTGGAGCIGSELAERLVSDGHYVTVIDNLSSGGRPDCPEKAHRAARFSPQAAP